MGLDPGGRTGGHAALIVRVFLSPGSLSWRPARPVLDLRVLLRGWMPLTGISTGGLPSQLVLGAVVLPWLPAEKGERLAPHYPGLGPVLGEGGISGVARVTS